MNKFLNNDFLLNTRVSKKLYYDFASKMPIIDYHCHVSPQEIYEDRKFENITQIWLGGDHYKWRLMRSNGIEEKYITGDASDYDKFKMFAKTLKKAIGNPMYHWCHLELKNYFGYDGILNENSAEEVWNIANEKLQSMSVRSIIKQSNVAFIGTTDDPIDDLKWHRLLKEDKSFTTTVAPSFRPDKALNIEKEGWIKYIKQLSLVSHIEINSLSSLKEALKSRIDYFDSLGCKASDHGLDYFFYEESSDEELNTLFINALNNKELTNNEIEKIKTDLLIFCSKCYKEKNWVMQLHFNCLRNPNTAMFNKLGPDTGFDCIGPHNGTKALAKFLNKTYSLDILPKTIIYSLDANDNAFIDTLIGSFQSSEVCGKIQHGSAWWFNDNKQGMQDQLISLANLSLLGNFVGMLTDSRSFLSYTRHEYFRRILCNLIGTWVENGEYPEDYEALEELVKGICFTNALKYLGLEE